VQPTDTSSGISVAIVGLGSFGISFVPLYLNHPDVARVVLCEPDEGRLARVAEVFGVSETATDLDAVLGSPGIDAVHLVTPMHLHALQSVAALDAGKHCACAVPAGLSLTELRDVIAAEKRSGWNYMMMETAVYTREFFCAKGLLQRGELGDIQFLRGAHYSDYESWPAWKWYPPMAYATHAIAPLMSLAGTRMASVRCLGSGRMPESLRGPEGNPYPVETAIFELHGSAVAAEVTRTIFRTARQVQEAFSVYGERGSFEWPQLTGEPVTVFRVTPRDASSARADFQRQLKAFAASLGVDPGVLAELIPEPRFPTVAIEHPDLETAAPLLPEQLRSFAGHGGAEAHLVHEFVRSIVEARPSAIGARVAADWTAPGLCAHQSAIAQGSQVIVPGFEDA
jgi:predicted dehydrogenase